MALGGSQFPRGRARGDDRRNVHEGATPERPNWTLKEPGLTPAERGLSMVLAVPAGWMVFALLLPAALYGVKVGWSMAANTIADRQDRMAGWGLVAACGFGSVACALLIAKVT
jgi:hypothetical protein